MFRFRLPVVVEGKYDKLKVKQLVETPVFSTEGFSIFNNAEKRQLIARAGRDGIILLCDSDGGGTQIRSKLKGLMNGIRVYDLYIPEIPGKEKRKERYSKSGLLGVEGMKNEVIEQILRRFADAHPDLVIGSGDSAVAKDPITRTFLYEIIKFYISEF